MCKRMKLEQIRKKTHGCGQQHGDCGQEGVVGDRIGINGVKW